MNFPRFSHELIEFPRRNPHPSIPRPLKPSPRSGDFLGILSDQTMSEMSHTLVFAGLYVYIYCIHVIIYYICICEDVWMVHERYDLPAGLEIIFEEF